MRILIQKDGAQLNLDEAEVRVRLNEKRLTLSDRAYCEGARDWWIPLREVLEFIASTRGERVGIQDHWLQGTPRQATRPSTPPGTQTKSAEYASLGQRVAAFVLDAIVQVIV